MVEKTGHYKFLTDLNICRIFICLLLNRFTAHLENSKNKYNKELTSFVINNFTVLIITTEYNKTVVNKFEILTQLVILSTKRIPLFYCFYTTYT